MPKSSEQRVPDAENPRWEKGAIANSMRLSDLSAEMQQALGPKRARGPQKAPKKEPVSIRLSADVLAVLRSKGRGWQTIADDALREKFLKHG